jgi:hypothetical protein
MMVVKVCGCGRSYTPFTWAGLPASGVQKFPDQEELFGRNCTKCGSTRYVTVLEDHLCNQIRKLRIVADVEYFRARLELALARSGVGLGANPEASKREIARARAEVKFLLREKRRCEHVLRRIWEARELIDPATRVGRIMMPVVDAHAKTEPPPAAQGA